jgi:hypothetical protein
MTVRHGMDGGAWQGRCTATHVTARQVWPSTGSKERWVWSGQVVLRPAWQGGPGIDRPGRRGWARRAGLRLFTHVVAGFRVAGMAGLRSHVAHGAAGQAGPTSVHLGIARLVPALLSTDSAAWFGWQGRAWNGAGRHRLVWHGGHGDRGLASSVTSRQRLARRGRQGQVRNGLVDFAELVAARHRWAGLARVGQGGWFRHRRRGSAGKAWYGHHRRVRPGVAGRARRGSTRIAWRGTVWRGRQGQVHFAWAASIARHGQAGAATRVQPWQGAATRGPARQGGQGWACSGLVGFVLCGKAGGAAHRVVWSGVAGRGQVRQAAHGKDRSVGQGGAGPGRQGVVRAAMHGRAGLGQAGKTGRGVDGVAASG